MMTFMPRKPRDYGAEMAAQLLKDARYRVLGTINNHLVGRYDPRYLAEWWRRPCERLGGAVPRKVVSGEFDPESPQVQLLVQVALDMAREADELAEIARQRAGTDGGPHQSDPKP